MPFNKFSLDKLLVVRARIIRMCHESAVKIVYVDFDGVICEATFSLASSLQDEAAKSRDAWWKQLPLAERKAREERRKNNPSWDDLSLRQQVEVLGLVDVEAKRTRKIAVENILTAECVA